MYKEPPIVSCSFGWGKRFLLYRDHLEVAGSRYPLSDLNSVQLIYRRSLGVSSARIVLSLRQKKLVLRGIPTLEDANAIATILTARGILVEQNTLPGRKSQQLQTDRPIIMMPPPLSEKTAKIDLGNVPLSGTSRVTREFEKLVVPGPSVPELSKNQIETPVPGSPVKILPPAARVVPQRRTHRFDEGKLARQLQGEQLPVLSVPILLLTAEEAHYSTQATLCGERPGTASRVYPPLDHGLLILTNLRMLYLGRRRQIILDYHSLLHVSRLRGAIAFQAEHWPQRAIFEVERPLECAMYLECILQRFQQASKQHIVETVISQTVPSKPYTKRDTAEIETVLMHKYDWDATEIRSNMPRWLKQLEASKENQTVS
ncbi:MAG TPA: hypothetical protein VFN23_08950 [Ktedonobacteraceae bacterium]|nr:hypothetical protein [Ktedonobacteraceae bacterium]